MDIPSINDGSNIRVCVRVRPLNSVEGGENGIRTVHIADQTHLELLGNASSGAPPPGAKGGRAFQFDLCCREDYSQQMVFDESGVENLVSAAVEGYSVAVLAYGATGSGKTYTMFGDEQKRQQVSSSSTEDFKQGVVPRAIYHLYDLLSKQSQEVEFSIRASNCEIYNEQVFDLLSGGGKPLTVRYNVKRGFYVQGLFELQCRNMEDLMAVVEEGHKNRRVSSHDRNADSSRSHSLLTVYLQAQWADQDDGHLVKRYGKLVFVDLAGSERLKRSHASDARETGEINKSLMTLGKVIAALASQAQKVFKENGSEQQATLSKSIVAQRQGTMSELNEEWVPYRDSTLTKLLMDCLGGEAVTMMFACVSSALNQQDETLSTLSYASRARNIANKPIIQLDPQEQLIANLRREIELLKAENQFLRSQHRISSTDIIAIGDPNKNRARHLPQLTHADVERAKANHSSPVAPSEPSQFSSRDASPRSRRRLRSDSDCSPPIPKPEVTSGARSYRKSRASPVQMPGSEQEVLMRYKEELGRLRKQLSITTQAKLMAEHKQKEAIAESEAAARDLKRIQNTFVFNNKNLDLDLDDSFLEEESSLDVVTLKAENARLSQLVRNLQEENEGLIQEQALRDDLDEDSEAACTDLNELQREVIQLRQTNSTLTRKVQTMERREIDMILLMAKSNSTGLISKSASSRHNRSRRFSSSAGSHHS